MLNDRNFTAEYGRLEQVSPLIRRIVARNPGPFTFLGTGTYVVGRGRVAVIDPGPDLASHVAALLSGLAGESVSHILITHTHLDHSPAAAALQAATGAPTYGFGPHGRRGETGESGADLDFTPDHRLADGDSVAGPGWRLEALHTPGHASNHLCFALPEEQALFSGDHVMGWSTTVVSPPDGDMGDYYASLDRVAARSFGRLWPTHGPPVTEVAPFLQAYKAHRLAREGQVLEQLAQGRERIAEMVPIIYADVDSRLHPAAAHSMLAHLIHLVRTGRAASDGAPGPQSRYRLA